MKNISENWTKIEEADYLKFGIISLGVNKIESAFFRREEDTQNIIVFYSMGAQEESFLQKIKQRHENINLQNRVIDSDGKDTSLMSVVWTKDLMINEKQAYACILKFPLPSKSEYFALQIYYFEEGALKYVQANINFDENEETLLSSPLFSEILLSI